MISAARGHCSAHHAACTGPLELRCPPVSVDDHAFMIRIALRAYAASPVICQRSACAYAASLPRLRLPPHDFPLVVNCGGALLTHTTP